MPVSVPTIPVAAAPAGSTTLSGLERYVGKSVADFCQFHYGEVGDAQNHCAHFVSHVLGLQFGRTCDDLLEWPQIKINNKIGLKGVKGHTVRVNDVYNNLPSTGAWSDTVTAPALIFATIPGNFLDKDRVKMGTNSKKHVGIFSNTMIYHYGNTADAVRKDSPADFIALFKKNYGGNTVFRFGTLPTGVSVPT